MWQLSMILTSHHGDRTAVGGCEYSEPEDPGNLQLDWLEVQLQTFRRRGVQVRSCSDWLSLIETDVFRTAGMDKWSCTTFVSKFLS